MVLEIPLHLDPDTGHKGGRFFKTLLEKSFEFVPCRRDSTDVFNLSLVLLLAEVDLIPKK